MKELKLPYKILIYDIETSLLLAFLFQLGEQRISHNQLLESLDMFGLITISYKWYGEPAITTLKGDMALEEFDKIAKQADVIIGKNNFRFDDKRLNTERMLKGLPPYMEFLHKSDDLESQLRRFFSFPSFSLDALSNHLGLGGKDKMDFGDWKDIAKFEMLDRFNKQFVKHNRSTTGIGLLYIQDAFCQSLFKESVDIIVKRGEKAIKKMGKYNRKDVKDTEDILTKVLPYIKLKYNANTSKSLLKPVSKSTFLCTTCGSPKIHKTEKTVSGTTKYQNFYCTEHKGYAGRRAYNWGVLGKHMTFTGKMMK